MSYKVIQWATGHVGIHALRGIAQHPDLELVGLWVSSEAKAGKDAGELCGIGKTGVVATRDAEALLAMPADCVSYMGATDYRPAEAIDDMCRILASGKNLVTTSFVPLIYPWHAMPGVRRADRGGLPAGRHVVLLLGHRSRLLARCAADRAVEPVRAHRIGARAGDLQLRHLRSAGDAVRGDGFRQAAGHAWCRCCFRAR